MRDPSKGIQEHYNEALNIFPKEQVVGIFLQGSQNYHLGYEGSDIDSKLIVTPSFEDIARLRKPVSTTHVRANNEHIDLKDIRCYMENFEKQNINFVEILFTPYTIVNPLYAEQINRLVERREDIAHMNTFKAVKAMKGMAFEKLKALEHPYESKREVLEKFGYDPKQLHHILRLEEFLRRYIAGVSFEECLIPSNPEYLIEVKKGFYDLETARDLANKSTTITKAMEDAYCDSHPPKANREIQELLMDVQVETMRIALKETL